MTVMDTAAPARTPEQRLVALARANEIRSKRAALKRQIRTGPDGRLQAMFLLAEPPDCMKSMRVYELLLTVPKVGRVKAHKILNSCRISPSKTLGGLTVRQRDELAGRFR